MAESEEYASSKPVAPADMVFEYLSNGSTVHATGNYLSAADDFRITCKTGSQKLHLYRMVAYIEDSGAFLSAKYGADLTLVNGIHVTIRDTDDAELAHLDGGVPILTNAQWGALCYDVSLDTFGAGNNGSLAVRWTFANSGKLLSLSSGQYLSVELNDDFTSLIDHTFMVQGYYN